MDRSYELHDTQLCCNHFIMQLKCQADYYNTLIYSENLPSMFSFNFLQGTQNTIY